MLRSYIIRFFAFSILVFLSAGCSKNIEICNTMFGSPIAATGLDSTKCNPTCGCKNFTAKKFTSTDLEELKSWTLTTPFEELTSNPYKDPVPESEPCVCAVVVEDLAAKSYHLKNFPDAKSAEANGAYVTHYDACGLCSTLQDLAVYAGNIDVGADVKLCGLANINKPFGDLVSCIEDLGFTKPCAQIWAYNTRNTQAKCIQYCLNNDHYNQKDGSLSPCLACDERESGPIFKAIAGRTRRNTGIASSICRPCYEVQPVLHNYPH